MSIETKDAGSSPTEITSDLQTAIDSMLSHLPLDPETARRVHERAEKVREELRRKGTTNIALDLLRESRDEE